MIRESPREVAGVETAAPRIRTLVVDDSAIALTSLCGLLELFPRFEVVGTARSGLEAIEQVEAKRPELVLMDLQMPGLNGLQASEAIRDKFPAVNVVIISVQDREEWTAVCTASGAKGFVAKSRLHEELPRLIGQIFRKSAAESK